MTKVAAKRVSKRSILLAILCGVALASAAVWSQPARKVSRSEKLASDLIESRHCESIKKSTTCHYAFQGLRFSWHSVPLETGRGTLVGVNIDTLEPGPVSVQMESHFTRCFTIIVWAEHPQDIAVVMFNVKDGKFYFDAHAGRCFPKGY